MEKLRLLGVLSICIIVLVSASANPNDPLSSGLMNTVFILSCGVMGVLLLRKANLGQFLTTRQRKNRRFGLPVEFPLTDSQDVTVIQDRRQLLDRREIINNLDDQNGILRKMGSN